MARIWVSGSIIVTAIAALKTYIVLTIALPGVSMDFATVSGMFALFFGFTAAVAYISFKQLSSYMDWQRKEKLAPGAGEPAAKETVILRYASDWGLSQAEADVAIFVVKGFSNSEIAEMRGSAIATVKSQLSRIYQKSGLETRYQLIGFVTDEVCGMAHEPKVTKVQVMTRKVLPLVGRSQSAG
ncbi:Transcriptional regulator, LuxR family [Sulfitobacter noctilucicola]|uniref:DNA-binding CsgD family transcriptional regulator n=1 Tax=Sulfitobacter noctilucicola TaxID=1342301 RepID=A0A7W6M5L6_9RHOB|nr:helix-turn-helix transcriptional regulator [Sulfitobacter noctilucicola]KIN62666.1 Transcriptional regulator, LuxR family [Sulfitobacter noctilucicola]MBB4172801.1 DNA-binding CsgD family transcriptional regulator [Sulfitobacter noctilucicola]